MALPIGKFPLIMVWKFCRPSAFSEELTIVGYCFSKASFLTFTDVSMQSVYNTSLLSGQQDATRHTGVVIPPASCDPGRGMQQRVYKKK
jgi:hypothetical protein